ncbi:MAG: YkgJ family cysteine cluster protein [bacterium]
MQICKSCAGGCCRNYSVAITGYDILNISKTLGIDPISFIQIVEIEDEADFEYKSKHAALFKFTDAKKDVFYMFGMRMVESQLVQGTAKCQFLMEWYYNRNNPSIDQIIARCGIYNCRPLICSAFPSKFDSTENRGVVLNLSSISESKEHPIYNLCSGTIAGEEVDRAADDIMKALILRKFELDYFKNLASYWNEKPGTITEFLVFMQNAYQDRVYVDQ